MRRLWLRAAGLVLGVAGIVAGLTVYLSTEEVPPCFVEGAPKWRPPTDNEERRFELVFSDRAACFFDMEKEHRLAGVIRLPEARGISSVNVNAGDLAIRTARGPFTLRLRDGSLRRGGLVPFPSDTLTLVDEPRDTVYVTQPRFFGFRTIDMTHLNTRFVLRFKGFAWNPRFGPNPPSHGLSLAPDRPELWVLDAPNSVVHLFDVSEVPVRPPRAIANIRLSKPLSGDERECVADCRRLGSLQHSADGRFVYVGDAGDVISTKTREVVRNLEALHNSRVMLEVDWLGGKPVFPLLHR